MQQTSAKTYYQEKKWQCKETNKHLKAKSSVRVTTKAHIKVNCLLYHSLLLRPTPVISPGSLVVIFESKGAILRCVFRRRSNGYDCWIWPTRRYISWRCQCIHSVTNSYHHTLSTTTQSTPSPHLPSSRPPQPPYHSPSVTTPFRYQPIPPHFPSSGQKN